MPQLTARDGSPPLTRGKESHLPKSLDQSRITPAYAGKRDMDFVVEANNRDHPRLRGEKPAILHML